MRGAYYQYIKQNGVPASDKSPAVEQAVKDHAVKCEARLADRALRQNKGAKTNERVKQ